ncbi:hypothetical protein FE249_18135 (plasmid) [Acidiphilium multivorum]|nr:hypothetical protein [Acidiphilium sp. C61]UNC16175.1 hypothetical protein FE249_18135 [Acidiphilium multivorum]
MKIRLLRRHVTTASAALLAFQLATPTASAQAQSPMMPVYPSTSPTFQPNFGGPAGNLARGYILPAPPATGQPRDGKPQRNGVQPTAADRAPAASDKNGSKTGAPAAHAAAELAIGATIGGRATALSGNMIAVQGEVLTLAGVTAPPAGMICHGGDGTPWACGDAARHVLSEVLASGPVRCRIVGLGREPYAECSIMGQSVNRAIVGRT